MRKLVYTMTCLFLLVSAGVQAYAQDGQEVDIEGNIKKQIEALDKILHLDDLQLFYIDSIYHSNYPAMMEEVSLLRKSGAQNLESYQLVQDKWSEANDEAIEKVLNPEQWRRYLASSFGSAKKDREKRAKKKASAKK